MPKLHATIKLNGAPAIGATANVEKLSDVPRLMRAVDASVRAAMKVFDGLRENKVISIIIRPE